MGLAMAKTMIPGALMIWVYIFLSTLSFAGFHLKFTVKPKCINMTFALINAHKRMKHAKNQEEHFKALKHNIATLAAKMQILTFKEI